MAIWGATCQIITGQSSDGGLRQSLTLEGEGERDQIYQPLIIANFFPDSMLITFQFSSGIFSLGQSLLGSIQLVKTANGPFFISQVQCDSVFGLSQGC